jgi:hypothetical protein
MSNNPETDLDLEKLFLPAWAQESPAVNRYAKYEGGRQDEGRDRRGDRRDRPPRGEAGFGGNRDRGRQGRDEAGRGPRRDQGAAPREPYPGPGRGERREYRPPPPPPEIAAVLQPDERGVDSMARQIRMTGRAYPLFEIAQLILLKPERHSVAFSIKKQPDGQPVQPLFLCALDDTLWLSQEEAVEYVLNRHFNTFYQAERTATEPPKGKYTFVAQCGMSGVILGPPNHHDYQNQLRKLHAERFARMPFEMFKARVRIVRDEPVVKQWVEDQSWKTEYVCLNLPEPLRLKTREELEKHFREVHLANIIGPVEAQVLSGTAARALPCAELRRLVRELAEQEKRFPLQLATALSQRFASRGLQFFKVNRTVTYVSVARPRHLDLGTTPVSDGVRRIVEFIHAHPKCTRRQLFEALAPSPAPTGTETAAGTGEGAAPQPAPAAAEPTPEQTVVIADLHWLIHQGHVIEFATGILENARKPVFRPPQVEATPAATDSPPASVEAEAAVPREAPLPTEATLPESVPAAAEPSPEVASSPAAVPPAVVEGPPAETPAVTFSQPSDPAPVAAPTGSQDALSAAPSSAADVLPAATVPAA